jgi:tRNA(adenine34) deaminase
LKKGSKIIYNIKEVVMKNEFMEEALKLAKIADSFDEVPIGCGVVCNGEIIGRGYNNREKTQNVLGHAEINAIVDATKNKGS